jgi:hypothetical protein
MKPREIPFPPDAMDRQAPEHSAVTPIDLGDQNENEGAALYEVFEKNKTPKDLLKYLRDNLEYGFVGKNYRKLHTPGDNDWNEAFLTEYYLQTSAELLKSKHGVCWDSVEIERDWFSRHNYEFKTFYLGFKKEADNDLPTHTFLAYKFNDKWFWFEQSFADHAGIHEYNDLLDLIKDVARQHFDYAIKDRGAVAEDFKYLKYCEYEKPAHGCSAEEFVSNIVEKHSPIDIEEMQGPYEKKE